MMSAFIHVVYCHHDRDQEKVLSSYGIDTEGREADCRQPFHQESLMADMIAAEVAIARELGYDLETL